MTEGSAIARIRSGDERSIAWVMDKYSRMLWKTVATILPGSEADVEECVADVFISLCQKPEQYDKTMDLASSGFTA